MFDGQINPRQLKGFDPKTNTLNGMPFISDKAGGSVERVCSKCKFRSGNTGDCIIPQAKLKFGFKSIQFLKERLYGKKTANFCPHFQLHL